MRIKILNCNLMFAAGKVHVYSDFDGTYCPIKHSSMHEPVSKQYMVDYCNKMDNFFKSTKENLDFHVTTGRTFGEYEAVSWLLKMRGYRLPFPDSLITKNGSDEFIKKSSDSKFYDNSIYPFDYNSPNIEKQKKIQSLTNWNGKEIKKYVKQSAKDAYFKVVEAESENSVKDYGNMSLFSSDKLSADEWKKLTNEDGDILPHDNPKADFILGMRKDGNLKINIMFPPDYGYCPIRNWIYDNYVDNIKNYLDQNHVKYFYTFNNGKHYRKSLEITPKIENRELTKIFDTKNAFKDAEKNNDLVIVAGDGSNDFDMLNPLEYIRQDEWAQFAENSPCQDFYQGNVEKKLRDLKQIYLGYDSEYINELREELTNSGFLQKIEKMPFIGIIIGHDNPKLKKLIDTFAPVGKIVVVEKGALDEGIKQGIASYASINSRFKNSMDYGFRQLVFNQEFSNKYTYNLEVNL